MDALRVVAVLGVVAIHVYAAMVVDPGIQGTASWWVAVAVNAGSIWVVPVFVMVSGALLLAPGPHRDGPGAFYRKRLLRLGPAFVFWQLFYILVVRLVISRDDLAPGQILASIAAGTPYTHLYFLYLIVGLYAVAPVLEAFLRRGGQRRAVIFAACVLGGTVLTYTIASLLSAVGQEHSIVLSALTQWIPYVGYFLAGWALRDFAPRAIWLVGTIAVTAAVIAEIVWQSGTRADHPVLNTVMPLGYLGLAPALAALGVFATFHGLFARRVLRPRAQRVLAMLSDAAFGVFLVHFVIMLVVRAAFAQADAPVTGSLAVTTAIWVVVVVLSFAISLGARRVPYLRRLL
nr:acyltransferase family protein [Microbacterium sp. MF43]